MGKRSKKNAGPQRRLDPMIVVALIGLLPLNKPLIR